MSNSIQQIQGLATGGNGGTAWDDVAAATAASVTITSISSITITWGAYINTIQVTYHAQGGNVWQGPTHGTTTGPNNKTIAFANGETIYEITGQSGAYVDRITSIAAVLPSGQKNAYGPFGGNGGGPYVFTGTIMAFYGRAGAYVDQLGFYQNVYCVQ